MGWSKKRIAAAAGASVGGVVAWGLLRRDVLRHRNRSIPGGSTILILGAGFAGVHVGQELSRLLPAEEDGQITLLDKNNFLLFTPMLTEVAGGELEPRDIVASPRRLARRVRFEQATVHDVDLANKSVVLEIPPDGSRKTIRADQIVIALGSVANYHDIPGVPDHSLNMKNIHDAKAIRDRVLSSVESADAERDAAKRRELLTFVVAGGGYTGVETMAAINDLARGAAKEHRNLRPEDITSIIAEPGERLLAELSPDLAAYAQRKLEDRGVQVRLKTKIKGAAEAYVDVEPGNRIPTRTLVWAGGVKPNPLIEQLDCRRGHHGGIVVDECCAVPDHPGVWAIGDCAEVPRNGAKGSYAPTAQNAAREGALVARNIVAVLRGERPQRFNYQPMGEFALVGRHYGVGRVYGMHFSGALAWAMWRAIYLAKMPGMAQRSRIAIDWTLDAIFGRETVEAQTAGQW